MAEVLVLSLKENTDTCSSAAYVCDLFLLVTTQSLLAIYEGRNL